MSRNTDKNQSEEYPYVKKFVRVDIFHSKEEGVADPEP